jgi:hypothetical protein
VGSAAALAAKIVSRSISAAMAAPTRHALFGETINRARSAASASVITKSQRW